MKIALFTKLNPKENNQHIFSVISSLRKASLKFEINDHSYEILKKNKSIINEEKIKTYTIIDETFDFVLAIGGDGTILESAKLIGKMSTPVIGLNKGRLGFLANSNTDDINQILNNSLAKVPHYILAQYAGAMSGACLVFFLYWDALVWYEH